MQLGESDIIGCDAAIVAANCSEAPPLNRVSFQLSSAALRAGPPTRSRARGGVVCPQNLVQTNRYSIHKRAVLQSANVGVELKITFDFGFFLAKFFFEE